MVDLSARTRSHVAALFRAHDVKSAEVSRRRGCGADLPTLDVPATPVTLERVRFAALRVSGGRLDRLRDAIELAQRD